MHWSLFCIALGCCIFSQCDGKSNFVHKKSIIKSANALRWLRRHALDDISSTPKSSNPNASVDRLTLMAFGVSLLQILLHALNENTSELVSFQPTTSTLSPLEIEQSDLDMNSVVEMFSNASRLRERMTLTNNDVCSQRAKCDLERKWRQLTSNVRSVIERSFRHTSYLDKDKPIWKLSIRPQKDLCALLYIECPIAKYSSYLISTYLMGAAKLK